MRTVQRYLYLKHWSRRRREYDEGKAKTRSRNKTNIDSADVDISSVAFDTSMSIEVSKERRAGCQCSTMSDERW